MMLNAAELCSIILVLVTLMFTPGRRVMGKLEHVVLSSCCKVVGSSTSVHDG